MEQRSITACLKKQHADSHSTTLCRRPHQRTHGLRVMMGLPGSLTHRALRSDVVCRKRAALLGTFSVCVLAPSAILVPPVHPTSLCRQLARCRMCAHRKGQPFSSAGKHKPDAVPNRRAMIGIARWSPLQESPRPNLGRRTNADTNAQQLSCSLLAALLLPAAVQACKVQVAWLVHQKESCFLCRYPIGLRDLRCQMHSTPATRRHLWQAGSNV